MACRASTARCSSAICRIPGPPLTPARVDLIADDWAALRPRQSSCSIAIGAVLRSTSIGADGLVPDSNLIRWVGAPAEITRWGQHDEDVPLAIVTRRGLQ